MCPDCQPRNENADNTPIRPNLKSKQIRDENVNRRRGGTVVNVQPLTPITVVEVREIVKSEIKDLLKHLNDTIASFVNIELKSIKEDISQVKESMSFLNDKYESFKTDLTEKFNILTELRKENSHLKSTVQDLSTRINSMEQQARANNVEIQCLPEHKGENLVSTVINLSKVISCDISENQIHHVTRIAKRDTNSKRPKSIVVQFNSPRTRDTFLAASIMYNKANPNEKLNSNLLGIGGAKENVYVVEHLSPTNKYLHAAARKKAKELNYKFVWVRRGRIFMRKSETSDYKYIRDLETLDSLS